MSSLVCLYSAAAAMKPIIFFSDSVNFSVTVGMHERLTFAADLLEERLGIRTEALPVIYMLGDQSDFESASRVSGKDPGMGGRLFPLPRRVARHIHAER